MKKIVSLLLALVLVFSFAACGNTTDTNSTDASSTEAKPVLKVGLECAYAPFNWTQLDDSNGAVKIDGTNQYANGYDVQIAKKIADAMGRELVICKTAWDGLIPGVQSGALDMIIAGMSPTADRRESIDFSDAYYTSNLVVVVRKDGAFANATSLNDFKNAKIVGQLGTFHEQAVAQIPEVDQQTSMKDFGTMIIALNSKAIDGYVAEKPGAIANCSANPDFTFADLINNDTGFTVSDEDVQIAVGVKKGSELTAEINSILATITQEERDTLMNNAIANQPAEE